MLFLLIVFKRCELDNKIYVLHLNDVVIPILLYVDGMLITWNDCDSILGSKLKLNYRFEITNIVLHFFVSRIYN